MSALPKKRLRRVKDILTMKITFQLNLKQVVIIDLNMLNDIFNNIAKCKYCDRSFCFDVAEIKVVAEDLLAVYQQLASIVALVMAQ
ncbi:hypothetical protein TNCT_676111 [Trichonephila clavata]|uniref:Uncharacterized protein n=1 Tax=Trichonephila clavata TaxID=2740835 RepID=A0A8X6FJA9_TRICU|nr:hypothetical protein TNCT_676111 [Trichonephila clavata]